MQTHANIQRLPQSSSNLPMLSGVARAQPSSASFFRLLQRLRELFSRRSEDAPSQPRLHIDRSFSTHSLRGDGLGEAWLRMFLLMREHVGRFSGVLHYEGIFFARDWNWSNFVRTDRFPERPVRCRFAPYDV